LNTIFGTNYSHTERK